MVLVDTNIWITLYRQQRSVLGEHMWALMAAGEAAVCGQIWVEFLGGFRTASERAFHTRAWRQLPFLDATPATYAVASELLARHPRLGAGDAIIAATAITAHAPLFTLDRDFSALTGNGLTLFS